MDAPYFFLKVKGRGPVRMQVPKTLRQLRKNVSESFFSGKQEKGSLVLKNLKGKRITELADIPSGTVLYAEQESMNTKKVLKSNGSTVRMFGGDSSSAKIITDAMGENSALKANGGAPPLLFCTGQMTSTIEDTVAQCEDATGHDSIPEYASAAEYDDVTQCEYADEEDVLEQEPLELGFGLQESYDPALTALDRIEEEQKRRWVCMLRRPVDELVHIEELQNRCREVAIGGGKMSIGIVGPRESGKSMMLSILNNELVYDLAATERWKHSFIVYVDMESMACKLDFIEEHYYEWIEIVFNSLCLHLPWLDPYCKTFKRYFIGIVENTSPTRLPIKLALNKMLVGRLEHIAKRLWECYHQSDYREQFYLNTLMLCIEIPRAFNLANIFVLIDNAELGNRLIDNAIEYGDLLKFLITQANCAMASHDDDLFYRFLGPDQDMDLTGYIRLVPTFNLVQTPYDADTELVIHFENGSPLVLSAAAFGGVPAYLSLWYHILDGYNILKDLDPESDEYEEALYEVSIDAEAVLSIIMDRFQYRVVYISRRTPQ